MHKTRLRNELLLRRAALTADAVAERGRQIQQRLLLSAVFAEAQTVALYLPIRGEVETALLAAAAAAAGKRVLYPRQHDCHLEFAPAGAGLRPGRYGIPEPTGAAVALAEIDLIALPGVAFDRRGIRLGYGKGCYDRTLAGEESLPLLVGLAYAFQLVERLPADNHDVPVDRIVTEDEEVRI